MRLAHRLFLIFFSVILMTSAFADTQILVNEADTHFFHQSFNDLREELQIVKESGKLGVFVMFNDEDCPWCVKMKSTVLNKASIQDYFRKYFQVITIDPRGDNTMTNFDGMEKSLSQTKKHVMKKLNALLMNQNYGFRQLELIG